MAGRKTRKRQAARRVDAVAARKRRWRWLPLPAAGALAGLVAFAYSEGHLALPEVEFPIRTLKVEAAFERVAAAEVAAVVAPEVTDGFFGADLGTIKQAVVALPWVRDASVRRVWPDALHITVYEQQPVARWGDEGLLNDAGELFLPAASAQAGGLPQLEGPPRSSQQVMAQYRRLEAQVAPLGLGIERLVMDPRRSLRLTLDNGITLVLGRRDAEQQIARFAQYWPGVIAARAAEIAEVDLRYPAGFAVKWQQMPAAHAGAGAGKTGDKV